MKEFAEKLIERLEERKIELAKITSECKPTKTIRDKNSGYYMAIDYAILIINQLAEEYNQDSTKNNQGWILCSERLPEEPDIQYQALEYFPEYNVTIEGAEISTTLHYLGDDEWRDAEGNVYDVVTWQPLPEVYKAEEPKTNFYF